MGICGIFENEDDIPWQAERELMSQGACCVAAAAVGSAPQSGSLSRSMVARMTGATSQYACMFTALCWIFLQPLMKVMQPTPKAALSAIIVSAVLKAVFQPKDLQKLKGKEYYCGWFAAFMTAMTSPTTGFGCGLIVYYAVKRLDKMKKA
jgi:MFS superfamily sulfate permease-like transporter